MISASILHPYPVSDAASIAQRVLRHRHPLLAYLYACVPDAHAVEDIFQEVCLVAVQKAADFEDGTDFEAWARAIARNKVREHLRARRGVTLDEAFFDALDAALSPVDTDRRKDALRQCLGELEKRARQILSWRYDEGLSPAEIAGRTGQSRAAVNSILQRIRETLRDCAGRRLATGTP